MSVPRTRRNHAKIATALISADPSGLTVPGCSRPVFNRSASKLTGTIQTFMIRPAATASLALAAVTILIVADDALAFELPAGVPARSDGLWSMERNGRITDGTTTFDVQKHWRICLDAKANRALHEFEVREAQAMVAPVNQKCDEPQFSLAGNALSSRMTCAGPSPIEDKIGTTTVEETTVFTSPDESRAETITRRRDAPGESETRSTTTMKRIGACAAGQSPGSMTMTNWRINGEESLKAMQRKNLYREIETFEQTIKSRLAGKPRGSH